MKIEDVPEAWKKALMLPLVRLLFDGAGNDAKEAWGQAIDLVCSFLPGTELEFRLVVRMSIFNIQSNLAFEWASYPDTDVGHSVRLQSNALALAKAADKIEARVKQLQSARVQRAKAAMAQPTPNSAPEPASASTPEATSPTPNTKPEAAKAPTSQEEVRAINEYARKNNLTYAQAWGMRERERKAAQANVNPASA